MEKDKDEEEEIFPSLEPGECQKLEEEFEKLTCAADEVKQKKINLPPLNLESTTNLNSSSTDDVSSSEEVVTKRESASNSNNNNINKRPDSRSSEVEVDEFQDEIHFDPTISSGHSDFRNTPIKFSENSQQPPTPAVAAAAASKPAHNDTCTSIDSMTVSEAEKLLSTEKERILSDEQAKEVVRLLTPDKELPPLPLEEAKESSDIGSSIESWTVTKAMDKLDSLVYSGAGSRNEGSDYVSEDNNSNSNNKSGDEKSAKQKLDESVYDERNDVHFFPDGHYWMELPAIDCTSMMEELPEHCYKKPGKLSFSERPVKQFSTFSVDEYDRRNEDIDPVAASAEYELEKRVEKMDTFPVDLNKGTDGLGLSIIGMGVGADTGLEKLGIFIKTITAGGSAERDGRIQVNDQIIEVDGKSLVGVTQAYAASVLRNTSGVVKFVIGRDKDPENSEVAQLIRQSLQVSQLCCKLIKSGFIMLSNCLSNAASGRG